MQLCLKSAPILWLAAALLLQRTAAFSFGDATGFLADQTYCRMYECCNEQYVQVDLKTLDSLLKNNLYGQHIIINWLLPALGAHLVLKSGARKPLVISFQGPPGTGKNYVAELIAQAIYKNGMKSKYVRLYRGKVDFPLVSEAARYSINLHDEVKAMISACPQSLFIFDEVDRMPPLIFEALTAIMNYISSGPNTNKAIFIFLSNTAQGEITDQLVRLTTQKGLLREQTKLSDFEEILRKGSYLFEGGLQKTSLISSHLIDHFMPFLPLEKEHVRKCIQKEGAMSNYEPKPEAIEYILQNVVQYDGNYGVYSKSGCKLAIAKARLLITFENSHTEL